MPGDRSAILEVFNKLNFVAYSISLFYFSYFKIFNVVPYHSFFLIIGIIINFKSLKRLLFLFDKYLIFLFIFLFIICLKSYIAFPTKNLIESLFRDVIYYFIIMCYVFTAVRNEKDVSFFIKTIVYIGSFSALIAIFQFFQFDFAWELRRLIKSTDLDAPLITQLYEQKKPFGLAFYSITLSYQMIILASIFFSRYMNYRSLNNLILLLFGFLAVFATKSESALFGFIFAILAYIFFNVLKTYTKILIVLIIASILVIILFILLSFQHDHSSLSDYTSRIYLFNAGIFAFKENFLLGLGGNDINVATFQYLKDIDVRDWVKSMSIHNSFLIPLIKHGVLMLLPFLLLFYVYFKSINVLKYKNKNLYTFFYVYIFCYVFHSFFHNAGIFNKDQLFWIIFTLLVAAANIYRRKLN